MRQDVLPHQRLLSARHAAPSLAPSALPGEDDVALYAASDNMSNVQALRWLLDCVWPRVVEQRPHARLQIAGLICRALPETAHRLPGVEVLGFRPDLSADTARAGVIVAPYLYGSGLKIKVVEAACGGKAIVTTRAGRCRNRTSVSRRGRGGGRTGCLCRRTRSPAWRCRRRADMAGAALKQARVLFSPDACYEPVVSALRRFDAHMLTRAGGLEFSATALRRIKTVVGQLQPARVVLWGNGTHTRALIAALETIGVAVALIVDGRAATIGTSQEGVPVRPGDGFGVIPGDLVILSSETFENDMWHALNAYRASGGWVLGLWDERRISQAIVDQLSPGVRAELGAPSVDVREEDAPPAIVLWDGYATPSRWWRVHLLQELAEAAQQRGIAVVAVTPSTTTATEVDDRGWRPTVTCSPFLSSRGDLSRTVPPTSMKHLPS